MNTSKLIKNFFIGLVFLSLFAGCAATSKSGSTGDYIDDSVITTKVKAGILNDPLLKVFQISVESYQGVVQLSGFVNSKTASDRAEDVASDVKGVKSVKNDLIVK